MSDISVTLSSPEVEVDGATGTPVTVSVTNRDAAAQRLVLGAFPPSGATAPADPAWATVERPLREVAAGVTEQYVVALAAPQAAAGTYELKLIAYPASAAPEEYADRGQVLRVVITQEPPPPPPPKRRWWPWVVAAVALVAVLGTVVWLLTRPDTPPPTEAGRQPATEVVAEVFTERWPTAVAVDDEADRAYVANLENASLSVIDLPTLELIGRTDVANAPQDVAVDAGRDRVYVADVGLGVLSVLDQSIGLIDAHIDLFDTPRAISVDRAANRVHVSTASGRVLVVDPEAPSVEPITVGDGGLRGIVQDADGLLYVADQDGDALIVVDPVALDVVEIVPVGSRPSGVALDPETGHVWVANVLGDSVSVVDTATREVVRTVGVGINPEGVAVDPEARAVYVVNSGGTVTVLDADSGEQVAEVTVGFSPRGIAVHAATGTVLVTNQGSQTVSVLRAPDATATP